MNARPTVSVVIPTYNRPALLTERALPSVLAQTIGHLEILVVGDGTDEETCERMRGLVAGDERIWFWNLPRQDYPDDERHRWGLSGVKALNFGWDRATGEWLAVLGDDDELLPDAYHALLARANETGADVVYGVSAGWTERGFTGQTWGAMPPGRGQLTDGANIRRRTLPYRYALDCWDRGMEADADLWTRMAADGVRFAFTDQVIHRYWRPA